MFNISYLGSSTINHIYSLHHFLIFVFHFSCRLNCSTIEIVVIFIIYLNYFIFPFSYILFKHQINAVTTTSDVPVEFILWILPTIIYIISRFLFQSSYSKPTLCCHCNPCCSSCKQQREITVCFVRCVNTLIWLRCYIVLIDLFILSIILLNTISTGFVVITPKKSSLYIVLGGKLCLWLDGFNLFYLHKFIVWVLLTIIYIVSLFVFQTSDLKPTLCCHCNRRCSSCK